MDSEPENQDWRKFGEGGKNRWKKDSKHITVHSHDKK